jgi:hypothetical protein
VETHLGRCLCRTFAKIRQIAVSINHKVVADVLPCYWLNAKSTVRGPRPAPRFKVRRWRGPCIMPTLSLGKPQIFLQSDAFSQGAEYNTMTKEISFILSDYLSWFLLIAWFQRRHDQVSLVSNFIVISNNSSLLAANFGTKLYAFPSRRWTNAVRRADGKV